MSYEVINSSQLFKVGEIVEKTGEYNFVLDATQYTNKEGVTQYLHKDQVKLVDNIK
ncbi:hypothetical protein D3C80_950080 [compost metagenome]